MDPELVQDRYTSRQFVRRYQNLSELDYPLEVLKQHRRNLLENWLGTLGVGVYIEPPFYCDYGYNVHLGNHAFINSFCIILDICSVVIGDETMLGPKVQLYAANHPQDAIKRTSGREFGNAITIGSKVWIGGGVIVNPGVMIGDNTTIGSGSVVTKNIPANVVAFGNPCKIRKKI